MNTHHIELSECDDELYSQLYKLNMGSLGVMRQILWGRRDKKLPTGITYIEEDGEVLAWALHWKHRIYSAGSRRRAVNMYVNSEKRKMGLGKAIVVAVTKHFKQQRLRPFFYPHDSLSRIFFDKMIEQGVLEKDMLTTWTW